VQQRRRRSLAAFNITLGSALISTTSVEYRILQKLGEGGNASVFLASCKNGMHAGALFAVKVLSRITDEVRTQRFAQEIETLRSCDHPAIMRFYDIGAYQRYQRDKYIADYPYFVAEYLPATLQGSLFKELPITIKISIVCQILSALVYLGKRDEPILHRDIKPQNIFLKGDSAVLGDLGLTKILRDGSETQEDKDRAFFIESTGSAFPNMYRTPDLVKYAAGDSDLTVKSDVFQLGLVAATLFTGRNPMPRAKTKYEFSHLFPLAEIPGPQFRARIRNLLNLMLDIDANARIGCEDALAVWTSLLFDAVGAATHLDGRVFARAT